MTEQKKDTRLTALVPLDFEVTVDGVTYRELTMRRPKTRDSIKAAKHRGIEAERGVSLLADLCDVSPDVIGELDESDTIKLNNQLEAFRGGQAT